MFVSVERWERDGILFAISIKTRQTNKHRFQDAHALPTTPFTIEFTVYLFGWSEWNDYRIEYGAATLSFRNASHQRQIIIITIFHLYSFFSWSFVEPLFVCSVTANNYNLYSVIKKWRSEKKRTESHFAAKHFATGLSLCLVHRTA